MVDPVAVTHLIIGSSPFQLVLGIDLSARLGPDASVVVAEAADSPGGAWRTGVIFGIPGLERGSHYIEADSTAYGVLERCGFGLIPVEPRPTVLVTRPVGATALDWIKNCALFGYGSLRRKLSFDRARHDARITAIRALKRVEPLTWRYPPSGCVGLIEDLVRRYTQLGGKLRVGRRVVSLHEGHETVACGLDDGSTIAAEHVHVTNNTTGIRMRGLSPFDPVIRTNVLVAVAGAPRPFSFVQVKGDAVIQVVTDIGRYARTPDGVAVIAVQLRPSALDERDPDDVGLVIERLRKLGLLRPSDVVTGVQVEYHPLAGHAGESAWRAATASSSRITVRRPEALYTSLPEFADAES